VAAFHDPHQPDLYHRSAPGLQRYLAGCCLVAAASTLVLRLLRGAGRM